MVQIDRLAEEIERQLNDYAKHTTDEVKQIVLDVAKDVKDDISANAPQKKGKYYKSWRVKKVGENSNSLQVVVHSDKHYQLTHLLEFGHATRDGGRTREFPHIASAEQRGIENFEEKIKEVFDG